MRALVMGIGLVTACGRLGFDAQGTARTDGMIGDGAHGDATACGAGWCDEMTPISDDLAAVFGFSSTDLWAVGGGTAILHRGPAGWFSVASNTNTNFRGVWGAAPNDLWAVGDDASAHWNGTAWSTTIVATSKLASVWGFSGNDVWVAGTTPNYAGHFDGTTWTSLGVPGALPAFHGIWGASPTDVWLVANNGRLLHSSGGAFTTVTSPTSSNLYTIHGCSANDVWAVGDVGTSIHYNGSTWSAIAMPTGNLISGVFCVSATEAYACGEFGAVLRWDGSSWSEISSGTSMYLSAVWGVGGEIRAVGGNATVIRKP